MRLVMLVCIVFFSSFLYAQQNEFMDINDLIKEGKYEQAIKILSSKEVEISSNPKVGYYLGICYFKTKNYELAEEYFEKAYKNGYITSNLLYNLGVTKYKLKKYKEAIEVLEKTKTDKLIYDKSLYLMIAANLKLRDKNQQLICIKN
jgi:tetratricopeptide (TPR) repeat protein